jgi:signal transduction histidine kinase
MALLLAVFGVGMALITSLGTRVLTAALRLRLRNGVLVEKLGAAHREVAQANRELEERVALRTHDLTQALQERDNFVTVISHELRAPLTSMMLSGEILKRLLERSSVELPQVAHLTVVLSRQMDRMRHLVDDLLDTSRLSAERMKYHKEPVVLDEVVAETLSELAPQLELAHIQIHPEVDANLRGIWDRFRIRQVLINLISNALKHGGPPISVTGRRRADRAEITVRDHGPGILERHLSRVFEPFERAGASDGTGGLGLGLFIAQRIVRAHGGSIRVESTPGAGAAFVVELPLATQPSREVESEMSQS